MRGTLAALSFLVPLLAGGCIDAVTSPDRELPELRGTQIGAAGGVSAGAGIEWAADGSALFFRSTADPATLGVVDAAGGPPVGLVSAWSGYRDLRTAADGRALYFVADTGAAEVPVVFRLPLTEGAPVALGPTTDEDARTPAEGSAVLPTPRSDTAALIVGPDSVFLDGPGIRRFIEDGCERLIDFEPGGERVLCLRTTGASSTYRILDFADGSLATVSVTGEEDGAPLDIVWTGSGIVTLFLGEGGYGVHEVATGESRILAPPPEHGFVSDPVHAALSRDGRKAAFWRHTCLDAGVPGECARGQSRLHIVDVATGASTLAAVATGATAGSRLAFSSDGSKLAYVFEATLYMVPVP